MAIRYDPPLIRALAIHVRERWAGCRVTGVWMGWEEREMRVGIEPDTGPGGSLVFRLHPSAGYVLHRPSGGQGSAGGTWHGFRRLCLAAVVAPPDERLLVLELAGGKRDVHSDRPPVCRLFVELHTNQWNAVLTRGDTDRIESVLWPRDAGGRTLRAGAKYVRPEGAREWAERPPTRAEWEDVLAPLEPGSRRVALLSGVAWTSAINVDWVLGGAATDPDASLLAPALARYLELRADRPSEEAWLVDRNGTSQPYPLPLGAPADPCDGILDAMSKAAGPQAGIERAAAEPQPSATADGESLEAELERRMDRVRKKRSALQRQLRGDDAEALRGMGHLLLAKQSEVPRGMESIVLQGFDGKPVSLELDPRLDAVENAERYYDRARRRQRATAELPGRIEEAADRLAELAAALESLRADGPSDELWNVAGGRPTGAKERGASVPGAERLPYRRFRSSGGLEIRVGRSARTNDDLTFRHSSPDDIWMHARQASGAHVVIRWDRRDQHPPQADLAEAAALAALYSEARHSGLVAVDWTRRKYVRKPRKAPPGTVAPDRVRTVFVEPDPEVARRLSVED